MKLMKLFAVLALVGISNAAFGHNFAVSNMTGQKITVSLKVGSESQESPLLGINKRHQFSFTGNGCLDSVSVNGKRVRMGIKEPRAPESSCQNREVYIIEEPYMYTFER